jgi:SAM-dependent methyltransferase
MNSFEEIYKSNAWGFGSGHGSLPKYTKSYRAMLEMFIKNNNISSVVDFGCGDWQFSSLVNWQGTKYLGYDIVESVIENNKLKYEKENINFRLTPSDLSKAKAADLLIVKDVLQHLSKEDIDNFAKKVLPKYKYALITNCVEPTKDLNANVLTGEFRPLDLRQKPFNIKGSVILDFSGPKQYSKQTRKFFSAWRKQVLLVEHPKQIENIDKA